MSLSPAQKTIAKDAHRFKVCIAGRRFGKTHLAIRELCKAASIPDRQVWMVAPTYRQVKQVVWRKLRTRLLDLNWVEKINESELTITLKNGSLISLKGADNADSLRGVGLDFLVMDEFADIAPEAWFEVLRPTLADTQGGALFIGTPKGIGNWAHDLYQMPTEYPNSWASWQFTTIDGGRVPQEEIESAKQDLDERTFRQEFLATFETFSGRIYYSFDRKENVKECDYDDRRMLYVGLDFNVAVMATVVMVRYGDTLHVIDEISLYSSNTQEICDELKSRYPHSKIMVYPDPSGNQRRSSANGETDLTILANNGLVVKAPRSHTPVRDRINAVNSRLCDSNQVGHLFVNPNCKKTIECLERQVYKEGSSQPDKDGGYDHFNDALGYAIDYMFPIRRDTGDIAQPLTWGHRAARSY